MPGSAEASLHTLPGKPADTASFLREFLAWCALDFPAFRSRGQLPGIKSLTKETVIPEFFMPRGAGQSYDYDSKPEFWIRIRKAGFKNDFSLENSVTRFIGLYIRSMGKGKGG